MESDSTLSKIPFNSAQIHSQPLNGSLAYEISPNHELCVEVTFDTLGTDPNTFLYVNIVDKTGHRRGHLSIRMNHGHIVLNTQTGDAWGKDQGCSIDFNLLRFWRIWLVLDSNRIFSARLGNETLCSISTDLAPYEIFSLESNVSAMCVLAPVRKDNSVSAILDLGASKGPTLIVARTLEDSNELGSVSFMDEMNDVSVLGKRIQHLGSKDWDVYTLSVVESSKLLMRTEGREDIIHDNRTLPLVEVSSGQIVARLSERERVEHIAWSQAGVQSSCYSRWASAPGEYEQAAGFNFLRLATPMSAFLALYTHHTDLTDITVSATHPSLSQHTLLIGPKIFKALEDWTVGFLSKHPIMESEWRMILLDWLCNLRDPLYAGIVLRVAPHFHKLLFNQTESLGSGTKSLQLRNDEIQPNNIPAVPGLTAANVAVWKALRLACDFVSDPLFTEKGFAEFFQSTCSILPNAERNWFALQLSAELVEMGLGQVLTSQISDDFIAETLSDPLSTWRYSSITVVLAVRGQYEDCVEIMESLSRNLQREDVTKVNLDALSMSIALMINGRLGANLSARSILALIAILRRFDSAEFTGFRHIRMIRALISVLSNGVQYSYNLQSELLGFVEAQYSSVPEFWSELHENAGGPSGDSFWDRIVEMETAAERSMRNFLKVSGHLPPDVRVAAEGPGPVIASGQRVKHLKRLMEFHSWGQSDGISAGSVSKVESIIRANSIGLDSDVSRNWGDISSSALRAAIIQLQPFPKVPHIRLLESLGRAALDRNFDFIYGILPRVLDGFFDSDLETESVVIDVVVWALILEKKYGLQLASLLAHVVARLRTSGEMQLISPALQSAVRRLTGASATEKFESQQISELREQYHVSVSRSLGAALSEPWIGSEESEDLPLFSDTLVAVITCRKYLRSRAKECAETWVNDAEALGASVIFFSGSNENSDADEVDLGFRTVFLPVGDLYEDLPEKTLAVFRWIAANTSFSFVLKIDDDCYLDAENYLLALAYRRCHYFGRSLTANAQTFDRAWHQNKSSRVGSQRAFDTSLLGSRYADGGGSYVLSRFSLEALDRTARSSLGLQLRLSSFFEDKLIGDLLSESGVTVSSLGYSSLQARRNFPLARPVLQIDRTFYPSALSGICVAHLDQTGLMKSIHSARNSKSLYPPRIFPFHNDLSLSYDSNMLEVLSSGHWRERISRANYICVSTFRNEGAIIPHFLKYYRDLGIDLFLAIDNLSDDGTREYLLAQDDVVLFSAANDYRDSHYGVDWQRTVLDHFCIGRWVVIADADEFLVTEGELPVSIRVQCGKLEEAGFDAAVVLMVDMYPKGSLSGADFSNVPPSEAATAFDAIPARRWRFNRGPFGNLDSYVSSFRHRLMPFSSPEMFTSQKVALFRFNPLMSFSEGFHFGAGVKWSPEPLAFLHYKYSADFALKAQRESLRGQHFGGGLEYRAYLRLVEQGIDTFWHDSVSEVLAFDGNPLRKILRGVDHL